MNSKISLGIAMLGIFVPLLISVLFGQIIQHLIIPTDVEFYMNHAVLISGIFFTLEIIRVICIGQSFFIKNTFFSVIGIIFGVLAILLYIAGNLIPALFSFNIEITSIAKGVIFILMWFSIILYMLITKAWIPIKIAGVISILPIFISNIVSIIFYGFMSDSMNEYGETVQTISSVIQWCILVLSLFPIILTIIWMFGKDSQKQETVLN